MPHLKLRCHMSPLYRSVLCCLSSLQGFAIRCPPIIFSRGVLHTGFPVRYGAAGRVEKQQLAGKKIIKNINK